MQLLEQVRPFLKTSWKELSIEHRTLWFDEKWTEKIAFKVSKLTYKILKKLKEKNLGKNDVFGHYVSLLLAGTPWTFIPPHLQSDYIETN